MKELMHKKIKSPVKYFGGKGNGIRETIYDHFPSPNTYDIYIEPFGGAANVLLGKPQFGIEIYNDLEENIYSLFKVVSDKALFPKFKEMCDLAIYSHQFRDEYKEDLKKNDLDILQRAFKYFYVNRTSVNGIGGFSVAQIIRRNMSKSTSDFLSSIDGLDTIHNRMSSVIIEKTDGLKLIEKYDKNKVFMYLDPPYVWSERSPTRYKVDMTNKQQEELINLLIGLKNAKILLSGYNCELYKKLTDNGWSKFEFLVNMMDGNRKPKTSIEVLWKNYTNNDLSSKGSLWQ